ncbi:hypothetical protein Q8A67_024242 [Cirrhinus molitorella]|uniref:Uncharacterized protein n=1 Tax=Cirrhinus molitorella TaxID=172907 RepID=A0AA88P1L6_9TELE|nr:hypothetical protein Q8A67_024242 [Cirrhinus molitorella]
MWLADGVPAGHTDGLRRVALTSSRPPSPLCQEQAPRDQPESPVIKDLGGTARVADGGLSWWGHLAINLGLLRNQELPSPQSTECNSTLP